VTADLAARLPDGGAATGSVGRSCDSIAVTCGPGQESCCTSPLVAGGRFDLGGTKIPGPPTTIAPFYFDAYEVTVGRFQKFLDDYDAWHVADENPTSGAGAHPLIAGSGWRSAWNVYLPDTVEELRTNVACRPSWHIDETKAAPMTCITWYEALAFCIWDGGRLPTEAEWEYAATGGGDGRPYPWGSRPDLSSDYVLYECLGDGDPSCDPTDILPVGSKPLGAGRWGQQDLLGSMYEWVLDWYADYATACDNCAHLAADGAYPVMRGGSWRGQPGWVDVNRREYTVFTPPGGDRSDEQGVRCARDLP
jgi:sulfatase modifying factor 1